MTALAIRSCPCGCGTAMLVARAAHPSSWLEVLEIEPVLTVDGDDPVQAKRVDWVRRAWAAAEGKRELCHG